MQKVIGSIRKIYWFFRKKNISLVFKVRDLVFNLVVAKISSFALPSKKNIGISTLLCHKDVNLYIYSLSSLFYWSGFSLPVYIVSDGSLTSDDYQKIRRRFKAIIIQEKNSLKKMSWILKKYKNIQKFRLDSNTNVLVKKFDAILTCPFTKFIYLDADILFYKRPKEIIEWINEPQSRNLYTAHVPFPSNMFGLQKEILINSFRKVVSDALTPKTHASFNSGLLCISNKSSINLGRLNHILRYFYKINFCHHMLAEELSLAYALKSENMNLLPEKKYVNVWADEEYRRSVTDKTVSIHYTGYTKREQLPSDAIKLAIKTNFFLSTKT